LQARLGAAVVDALLAVLVFLPGLAILLAEGRAGLSTGLIVGLVGLGALVVFQMALLTSSGQTVGKKVVQIRIVRFEDSGPPGFAQAVLLRNIVPGLISAIPIVGGLFGLIDILMIFGPEHRCLHDRIAHTLVVQA
jgi:uncharacterized RDD family membrane protein YckC